MFCLLVSLLGLLAARFLYEYIRRKPVLNNLNKKYILITGCDTGFGNALAKKLDSMGCLVFAACYTTEGAETLKNESSSRLTTLQLDVSEEESIKKAFQFVSSNLPKGAGLWGLVNNAGISTDNSIPLEFYRRQDFQDVLDVNLLGMIDMCITFLPLLKATKGRIVNMTSVAGRLTAPTAYTYCVSKYGAESFSDGLRAYCQQFGIKVSIMEPSFFKTPIADTNRIRNFIQKGYDRLPEEVKTQFVPDYVDKCMEGRDNFKGFMNTNISLVVDAYVHALVAVHPKKRYSLGLDACLLWIPLSYLPSFISDSLLSFMIMKPLKALYKHN